MCLNAFAMNLAGMKHGEREFMDCYVEETLRVLNSDERLASLLRFAKPFVDAGWDAVHLVSPILFNAAPPDWPWMLSTLGDDPTFVRLSREVSREFSRGEMWNVSHALEGIGVAAGTCRVSVDTAMRAMHAALARRHTPLGLDALLQALGRETCAGRLAWTADAIEAAGLIT